MTINAIQISYGLWNTISYYSTLCNFFTNMIIVYNIIVQYPLRNRSSNVYFIKSFFDDKRVSNILS